MDIRQAWCLGFTVAITLAAIGSIAMLTDSSFDAVLATDHDVAVTATGSDTPAFSPVVELPAVLQAGATTSIAVGLLGVDDDTPTGSLPMVQLKLELELVPAARGWVRIPSERHLVAPEDLHRRSFALQVAPTAPCGIVPGHLIVSVTSADGAGSTGRLRHLLPPIACDQLPPAAPPSLLTPAGSCAEFDDNRPLAAAVVEPPGCNEPVRRRAPRPTGTAATADADSADEPDGPEDPNEDRDGSTDGDDEAPADPPTDDANGDGGEDGAADANGGGVEGSPGDGDGPTGEDDDAGGDGPAATSGTAVAAPGGGDSSSDDADERD